MTDKALIVFGNITFEENPNRALIHEVEQTLIVSRYIAAKVADDLCNEWAGWIIPSQYTGEIVWE